MWPRFSNAYLTNTYQRTETENNITGITKSPLNTLLSCGGSSGGEGALLGLRGSSVGLGTDIGVYCLRL